MKVVLLPDSKAVSVLERPLVSMVYDLRLTSCTTLSDRLLSCVVKDPTLRASLGTKVPCILSESFCTKRETAKSASKDP